jgi:protein required for attachment to host cells
MDRTCIVVADSRRARFFSIEASDSARHPLRLVEGSMLVNADLEVARRNGSGGAGAELPGNRQAGTVHPTGAQHERRRLEVERRFGREIARHAGEITGAWTSGAVILVAAPRLLGLMRETVRAAIPLRVELKELAKDYTMLSSEEIRDRLVPGTPGEARG